MSVAQLGSGPRLDGAPCLLLPCLVGWMRVSVCGRQQSRFFDEYARCPAPGSIAHAPGTDSSGVYGDCVLMNTDQMSDTTRKNIVWGCPKHQGPLLGATLHRRIGPGQSCKFVDNTITLETSQTQVHTHSTPVFHTTSKSKTHNMPHTNNRTPSQQERIKAAQDHGLAPRGWRAIASEAQVAAHCRKT